MTMMKCFESVERGLIVVSLGEGDLLLESIQQAVRQADVHTGVIVSGLGSLTRAHIHTLGVEAQLPGPLEVVGLDGIVAGYEPHIHISLTDATGRYYGGNQPLKMPGPRDCGASSSRGVTYISRLPSA